MNQSTIAKIVLAAGLLAIAVTFVSLFIYSKNRVRQEAKEHQVASQPAPADENMHPGQALITKNDCRTCHRDTTKLIGPTYKEIAERYSDEGEGTIQLLINKIKHGGEGTWGPVPMTPHVNLSDSDARQMVDYILSLDD